MTTDRPYRRARTTATALEEMRRGAGSQFDPDVVLALFAALAAAPARSSAPAATHMEAELPRLLAATG